MKQFQDPRLPDPDKIKLKLVSEGMGFNTKLIDMNSGKELQNVTKITWSVSEGFSNCIVELEAIPAEILGYCGSHIVVKK